MTNTRLKHSNSLAGDGVHVSVDELLNMRHLAKDITLETRRRSVAMMDGDSRSSFRGRGMEFSEVRPYQPGDDIRNIDWRVTARTQQTYTKLFQEERERPVYLLVDQRSSMFFGSQTQFKSVYAAKLAALIGWAALLNNDRLGALIFSDTEQTDSRARRGKHAVLAMLHQLQSYNEALNTPLSNTVKNSLVDMLTDVRRVAKPGSSVFILSDFHDYGEDCAEPLSMLARHCDVTAIQLYDTLESELPSAANYLTLSDGKQKIQVNPH